MAAAETEDEAQLLAKLSTLDLQIKEVCDLIPISTWGFDEAVHEKLRHRKDCVVGQHLVKQEKTSKSQKKRLARRLGVMPKTVSEVLRWMAGDSTLNNIAVKKDKKAIEKKAPPARAVPKKAISEVPKKEVNAKASKAESSSDSEEENDSEDEEEAVSGKPEETPILASKIDEKDSSDDEDADGKSVEADEPTEVKKEEGKEEVQEGLYPKKGKFAGKHMNKRNNDGATSSSQPASKKPKTEEASVDPKTLNAFEAREVAMQKLQEKLAAFKTSRRGQKTADDYEKAKKAKRKMSKLKLKQKKAVEKEAQKTTENGHNETSTDVKAESTDKKETGAKKALESKEAVVDGVTYSKFDFIVRKDKEVLTKKDKRDKFTGKDYKRLLEKAERRQDKIESIRAKNPEKADRIEENIKWNKVLHQAEGQKVKDNVELLKKAAKRKEKTKERSLKKWDERKKQIEEKQDKRQEKRQTNIQKRKDDVKKKKMDKLRKKGRIL